MWWREPHRKHSKASAMQSRTRLQVMLNHPGSTLVEIATHLRWLTREGEPSKQKVHRMMAKLQKAKLVMQRHDERYVLTKSGEKAVAEIAKRMNDSAGS